MHRGQLASILPNDHVLIRTRKLHKKERSRIAKLYCKRVIPTISTIAWDIDKREIWDIPAARRLATVLLERWPRLAEKEENQWIVVAAGLRNGTLKQLV